MNYSPLLFLCYTVRFHGRNCMLFPYNPSTLKISAWDIVGTQKKKKKEHKLLIPNISDKLLNKMLRAQLFGTLFTNHSSFY